MLPMANNGAGVIYRRLIKPFITKNEKAIDEFIGEATALTKEAGKLGNTRDLIFWFHVIR